MIINAFESQNVGRVGKVDFVAKNDPKTGRNYNNVYLHFTEWESNQYADDIRTTLLAGETFQYYYTLPSKGKKEQKFFWNLHKNNFVKKPSESKKKEKTEKKEVVFIECDTTTADDFEEIATEDDMPYGFIPIPDTSLVSSDYVCYLEQSQAYWMNQCSGYQGVIDNLIQQLEFYKQKSDSLEQNIGLIEQNMREELDYQIKQIRGVEEVEDGEEGELYAEEGY